MKRYVLGLFSRQLYTTAGAEERLNASEVSLLDAVEHSPRKEKLTLSIRVALVASTSALAASALAESATAAVCRTCFPKLPCSTVDHPQRDTRLKRASRIPTLNRMEIREV